MLLPCYPGVCRLGVINHCSRCSDWYDLIPHTTPHNSIPHYYCTSSGDVMGLNPSMAGSNSVLRYGSWPIRIYCPNICEQEERPQGGVDNSPIWVHLLSASPCCLSRFVEYRSWPLTQRPPVGSSQPLKGQRFRLGFSMRLTNDPFCYALNYSLVGWLSRYSDRTKMDDWLDAYDNNSFRLKS